MNLTTPATTQPADGPFSVHPDALHDIARQLGEVRLFLDLGYAPAARAQAEHTQAAVRDLARRARLDLMFPGA